MALSYQRKSFFRCMQQTKEPELNIFFIEIVPPGSLLYDKMKEHNNGIIPIV